MLQSIDETLPPELWEMCCVYLPRTDLRSLTLTCTAFRWIAQPKLFDTLKISVVPRAVILEGVQEDRTLQMPLTLSVARLRFFACERIRASVQSCHLTVERSEREDGWVCLQDGTLEVMDEFLRSLPSFPNVSKVSFTSVMLDARELQCLGELRSLKTLVLSDCRLIPSPTPPTALAIEHLQISGDPYRIFPPSKEGSSIGMLFDLTRLRTLNISRHTWGDETSAAIFHVSSDITPFLNLTTLSIPSTSMLSPSFPSLIARCPRLHKLELLTFPKSTSHPYRPPPVVLSSTMASHLEVFVGPDPCTPTFTSRALRKIVMTSGLELPYNIPEEIIRILSDVNSPSDLEDLTFGVYHITGSLLDCICDRFSSLKSLAMTIWTVDGDGFPEGVYTRKMLISQLPHHLPRTLIHLELHTRFSCLEGSEDIQGEALSAFIRALLGHCKCLQTFRISFQGILGGILPVKSWIWERTMENQHRWGGWEPLQITIQT
ncbi:hypothetical protein JAAARDRAFT_38381 [Jaapia argillacea MUCL 33604]|uniref:F-box domain-containing protein n=1 Tax=Jaapia argillacea MUCL 33604 TaxID=933084 RepID=A0A067PK44_9AGAM|nr:hypothetical protein JAAARDRAFT_38381 [Jaapia argillacea MUCL 33604]